MMKDAFFRKALSLHIVLGAHVGWVPGAQVLLCFGLRWRLQAALLPPGDEGAAAARGGAPPPVSAAAPAAILEPAIRKLLRKLDVSVCGCPSPLRTLARSR